ncbi:vascular endothelial growth factor A-A-like [Antennarius striatus]|uniref:vascular endothelial growth factor A-A-like n=1 Tax=Antennarius striatus TaxID=241820 RepID=UPI0035B1DC10
MNFQLLKQPQTFEDWSFGVTAMNLVCGLVQVLLAGVLHFPTLMTASISKGVEKQKDEVYPVVGSWMWKQTYAGLNTLWHYYCIDVNDCKDYSSTENQRCDLVVVVPLTDSFTKSVCRPREALVDVLLEYPDDTDHTYVPSCVVLKRCGGCCSDEAMGCVATETCNITLQVMRFRPQMTEDNIISLSFIEHQKCDCRLKSGIQAKKE